MRFIVLVLGIANIKHCTGLKLIELSVSKVEEATRKPSTESDPVVTEKFDHRRYWLVSGSFAEPVKLRGNEENEEDKDENLKSKISTLVEQTLHDSQVKIRSLQPIKDVHRDEAPYKAGFILSLIKKSKDVLNELFNVAIRHKDDWKALEQLKVFELIVHTNVDTTNLVRQLVEVHIQHMNATNTGEVRKRVVLL